jgi:hypothetical protein
MIKRIPPIYLYRLRTIAEVPRFYKPSLTTKWLEKRGLIEATGQQDAAGAQAEFAITEAGRQALARAIGDRET